MIRRSARNDPTAGSVIMHDKPLVKSVEEYASEMRQNERRASFEEGWKVGYLKGLSDARRAQMQHIDPNSEESR